MHSYSSYIRTLLHKDVPPASNITNTLFEPLGIFMFLKKTSNMTTHPAGRLYNSGGGWWASVGWTKRLSWHETALFEFQGLIDFSKIFYEEATLSNIFPPRNGHSLDNGHLSVLAAIKTHSVAGCTFTCGFMRRFAFHRGPCSPSPASSDTSTPKLRAQLPPVSLKARQNK